MVGTGVAMLVSAWLGLWLQRRNRTLPRWFLGVMVVMTFAGWVATLAGWYVTEIGRQPWLVTGILRAADAASTVVSAPKIALSLALYLTLYLLLIAAFMRTLFYLAKKATSTEAPVSDAPWALIQKLGATS
jgi:cytochrome bd ubiquinol oxidase subunit I